MNIDKKGQTILPFICTLKNNRSNKKQDELWNSMFTSTPKYKTAVEPDYINLFSENVHVTKLGQSKRTSKLNSKSKYCDIDTEHMENYAKENNLKISQREKTENFLSLAEDSSSKSYKFIKDYLGPNLFTHVNNDVTENLKKNNNTIDTNVTNEDKVNVLRKKHLSIVASSSLKKLNYQKNSSTCDEVSPTHKTRTLKHNMSVANIFSSVQNYPLVAELKGRSKHLDKTSTKNNLEIKSPTIQEKDDMALNSIIYTDNTDGTSGIQYRSGSFCTNKKNMIKFIQKKTRKYTKNPDTYSGGYQSGNHSTDGPRKFTNDLKSQHNRQASELLRKKLSPGFDERDIVKRTDVDGYFPSDWKITKKKEES